MTSPSTAKSKKRIIKRAVISACLAVALCLAGVVCYAYFSTRVRVYTNDGDTRFARLGMNLSLLFDKIDPEQVAADTDLGILQSEVENADGTTTVTNYTYDSTAEWGSAQNPYVISDIKHLQNLSALQNIGYFDDLFISQNYTDTSDPSKYTGDADGDPVMPYFLICTPDGKPVTIDGTDIILSPIGTEQFPFIGYVGGAFAAGTATVGTNSSDTSAIYNITVRSTDDVTDVGLFGHVSYMGTEPEYTVDESTGNITYDASFAGAVSTLRDMLLTDVKVIVDQPTAMEAIADAIEHMFTYSMLSESDQQMVAHEDHHIGILAGHVEYTTVEFISVYYSSDSVNALDVLHTDKNYYSSTGIMGFVYNMNPVINADGTVGTGSGTSSADILLAVSGAGTGGGLASGTGRGYVTAAELFEQYNYTSENRDQGQIVWEYTYEDGENIISNDGILIYKNTDGTYTLDDGVTPVTVDIENGVYVATVENNKWSTFIVRTGTDPDYTYYTYKNNTTTEVDLLDFHQKNLMIIDGVDDDGNPLCTEWIRNRLLWGTEATGRYYFYDGVFTFCLSSSTDVFRDTWKNNSPPEIIYGENNDDSWTANTSKGNKAVVAYVKSIEGTEALDKAISDGKKIFIAYQSETAKAGTALTMMSLVEDVDDGGLADNAYRMLTTTQHIADESLKSSIVDSLENSVDNDLAILDGNGNKTLIADITAGDTFVINLGSAEYIEHLRSMYQIEASKNGDYYQFKGIGTEKYLSLIKRQWWLLVTLGPYYNIYCGTDAQAASTRGYQSTSKDATVTFNASYATDADPYFTISYTNEELRYVQYDGSEYFSGSETQTDNTKLYFYTVEGMHNMDFGQITFDPSDGTSYNGFMADEAILWPNTTYKGNAPSTTTTYTLKTLEDLANEQNSGWKNNAGQPISPPDLHKKFNMTESPGFGVMLNLLGGSLDLGDSNQVVAPVGTNGVEANIPMGCVAFRINTAETSKIRVIVAVPVSEFYDGEGHNDAFFDLTYRFGLWQVEEAGGSMVQSFNVEDAIEQFELPRSNPYKPGTTAGEATSNYVTITDGVSTYRCYLNGLRVLVGYEFTVTGEGVYILGTTSGPMEIVYFSADGTASAGRDGTSGSKLGSIDFVYDYNGSIVTVKEESDSTDGETYSKYYASLCLMYTDNNVLKDDTGTPWQFFKVNDLQITIRRSIATTTDESGTTENSVINLNVASSSSNQAYLKCVRYSYRGDTVNRSENTRQ